MLHAYYDVQFKHTCKRYILQEAYDFFLTSFFLELIDVSFCASHRVKCVFTKKWTLYVKRKKVALNG